MVTKLLFLTVILCTTLLISSFSTILSKPRLDSQQSKLPLNPLYLPTLTTFTPQPPTTTITNTTTPLPSPTITNPSDPITSYFKLFPFPDNDQYVYFYGRLDALTYTNSNQKDVLTFTFSSQFLSYYTTILTQIQFYDHLAAKPLTPLTQFSFQPSDHDVYVDIPLKYNLAEYQTTIISFNGYFKVLKRNKTLADNVTIQPPLNNNQFVNKETADHLNKDEQVNEPTHWQILATYYPENGRETDWHAEVELVYPAGSTIYHPDIVSKVHGDDKDDVNNIDTKSTIDKSTTRKGDDKSTQDRLCLSPLSTSFNCNQFKVVRTPAGSTGKYQYSFRTYIGELQAPVIGFNVTLFGGLYAHIYDKSGCKMNSLMTTITSQEIDEETGLFSASIELREGYQRYPKDDYDPEHHYTYFPQHSSLDIWCWFVTDYYHPDIAAGVSLTLNVDPYVVSPLDLYVLTMFTSYSTKLDTVTNHVVNPYRALYNIYELGSEHGKPPMDDDNITKGNLKGFYDLTITQDKKQQNQDKKQENGQTINNSNLSIVKPQRDELVYQQITCEWYITSDIPFLPIYFNDTMQLAVNNIHTHSIIEQAHISYSATAPQVGDSILKNTNLVLYRDDLPVEEYTPAATTSTTRIIFKPIQPDLDPVATMQISTQMTKLSFSVLTSIHPSRLEGFPLEIPQCTLQYNQLYPNYNDEKVPTRVPMYYSITNKPSFTLFDATHQWLVTANEISTQPSKYAFQILIFNITSPRPVKWVVFDLVTSQYRFEGDFSENCFIGVNHKGDSTFEQVSSRFSSSSSNNNNRHVEENTDDEPTPPPPMDYEKVRPLGQDQRYIDPTLWTTALGFDFYYDPGRYYYIECPDLYLIKSNLDHTSAPPSPDKNNLQNNIKTLSSSSSNTIADTDGGDDIIQITMMAIETDSYTSSLDDYYYGVTTIRFTHNDDTNGYKNRLKRLIIQLSLISFFIILIFVIFCCCCLDQPPPLQSRLLKSYNNNNNNNNDDGHGNMHSNNNQNSLNDEYHYQNNNNNYDNQQYNNQNMNMDNSYQYDHQYNNHDQQSQYHAPINPSYQ